MGLAPGHPFDFDKADIRPSEMSKIADIAAYAKQNPGVRLGIDGATDLLRGTNQYNVSAEPTTCRQCS